MRMLKYQFRAATDRRSNAGFTLIEIMIVVAIIGILAAIAIPRYQDYVRRGQLSEAFNALSDYRSKMEQYYQDNRNYGVGGVCASGTSATWKSFAPVEAKYFSYSCATTNSGQGYKIKATGGSGQLAAGHEFFIDQDGARTTEKFKNTVISPAATCWLTSSSSC